MEYSEARLVCFSPTHSSHIIGEYILKGVCAGHATETDLTYEAPQKVCIRHALTVVVVPVYGGRVAETAMERLAQVWGEDAPVIPVVVYGNRDYEDALLELKDWCVSHGFTPVAAAAFIGEHSYSRPGHPIAANRPDGPDLRQAEDFGRAAMQKLAAVTALQELSVLSVKGNYPYKVKGPSMPQTPLTLDDLCTLCGFCADICPTRAIMLTEKLVSDPALCIKCCACVKQCPQAARVFDTPYTDMLFKNFSVPRQPELFF